MLLAGAWALVLALDGHGDSWRSYRRDALFARTQIAAGDDPTVYAFIRPPDIADVVTPWVLGSVVLAAAAILGVALVRAGRPLLGLVLPTVLVTIPLLDRASLVASTLLLRDSGSVLPRLWPLQEVLPQLAVVLIPVLLVWRTGDIRGNGAHVPRTLVVAALLVPAALRLTDSQGVDLTDRAENAQSIMLVTAILGTGLLVTAYRRDGVAAVATAAALLALAQASPSLFRTHSGNPPGWFDVVDDAVALVLGPAVVLLTPALGRLWIAALRHGPVLGPGDQPTQDWFSVR